MEKIIFIMLICSLSGCANHLMKKSVAIEPGISKEQLLATMGTPGNRQFHKTKEAWQYCETGGFTDDYVIVWMDNGIVSGVQTYTNNEGGLCSSFFKTINWEESPDRTIEIRSR